MNTGRRAAIIDEIERRLSEIKICNGYNLDIALIQKRFPYLEELTRDYGMQLGGSTEAIQQPVDADFSIPDQSLPALFLQYGNLGNAIDRSETVGPNSHLTGQSRFANINQLEERFPIVIRGVVRENDPIRLCEKKVIKPDTEITIDSVDTCNTWEVLVQKPSYNKVPDVAQISFALNNIFVLPESESNDLPCIQVKGKDLNNNEQEEIINIPILSKMIYNEYPNEPLPELWDFLTDDRQHWDWQEELTDESYAAILYRGEKNDDGKYLARSSKTFKLNALNRDEIKLIYLFISDTNDMIPFVPSCYDWGEDGLDLSTTEWEEVPETGEIDFQADSRLYLCLAIKEIDNNKVIYTSPFEFFTGYDLDNNQANMVLSSTVEVNIYFTDSKNVDFSKLVERDFDDTRLSDIDSNCWQTTLPENSTFIYTTIEQIDPEMDRVTYSSPQLLINEQGIDLSSLQQVVTTQYEYKELTSFEVKNINIDDVPIPYLRANSLPTPLTTLVSQLHTDVQKAIYLSKDLLSIEDANGILTNLLKFAGAQDFVNEDAAYAKIGKEFEKKMKQYLDTKQIEKKPVTNIDLGISGVEDFIITDWYTLEGAGSPFEVIDFRLVIWHIYPKGSAI